MSSLFETLLYIHSYLRYLILALIFIVIIKSIIGWLGKQNFTNLDNQLSMTLTTSAHFQLLLGIILYFMSAKVAFSGNVMSNAWTRYWTVEHLVIMLIAIVLITLGRAKSKRANSDLAKFKTLTIFTIIALVVVAIGIMQIPANDAKDILYKSF